MRILKYCLIITLALGLVSGCSKQSSQPTSAEKPKIALVMKSLANEFFKTMADGAEDYQKERASEFDLIVNGIKDELDVNKQVELVEQMIAQGVDAIIIAPADSKALVAVCKKASGVGIIVINIDNKFDSDALKEAGLTVPFVGPDNRKGAKLVGDELAKTLKAGDKVAVLEGAPNAFNGEQRRLGFEDAMKAAKINIVASQSGYWETDKANRIARDIITANPDIKALLCANDSMAIGAVKAVEESGKSGKIVVVGYDNISAAQQLLKEGKILATADQHADQLAVYGIEYALEMIGKKAAPADKETPVDLVTAKSLE